ncbi:hypothetical protein MVEN_00555000 [Mycena venus]|uniref:Uncharacterized protein n=1 Tax=Mycena venus TaxID=2733690 RepID=A0A8H6YLH7_9AGAR|nr:hypothetical protein MVEN_00555000 [Mycena venus]
MSLDQNLFTLVVTPSTQNPNVVDLVDPAGRAHYRKQRIPGPVYKTEIYDPLSEALPSPTAPSASSKIKFLELCNPTKTVELKYTGTLSFRWSFKWEEHDFEWKREECYMLRKPDPPVLVAVTKEPPGRLKTTSVQILDYNLQRFDIDDRKGLEIVILMALMTFQDANDVYHTPEASSSSPALSPPLLLNHQRSSVSTELQRFRRSRGQFNEVTVEDEGSVEDYAQYCANLFQDDMLFVTVLSAGADQVPKVLQVVEETKRIRHKAGLEEELNQYVLYDTQVQKGPKRINLDDTPAKSKYAPPESLTVHLSKIPMPELQPKPKTPPPPPVIHDTRPVPETKESKKEQKKREEAKRKEEKKAAATTSTPPTPNKLTRPGRHSYYQPAPSPSQLNNPGIYVAPPPYLGSEAPTMPARPHSADETAALSPSSLVSGLRDMFHRPRSSS